MNKEVTEKATRVSEEDFADYPKSRDVFPTCFTLAQMKENAKQAREATQREDKTKKYQILEDEEVE